MSLNHFGRPLIGTGLYTSGPPSPYDALLGRQVYNSFDRPAGRLIEQRDGSSALISSYGFKIGDVRSDGAVVDRGYVKDWIENRPFGSPGGSFGLPGGSNPVFGR